MQSSPQGTEDHQTGYFYRWPRKKCREKEIDRWKVRLRKIIIELFFSPCNIIFNRLCFNTIKQLIFKSNEELCVFKWRMITEGDMKAREKKVVSYIYGLGESR